MKTQFQIARSEKLSTEINCTSLNLFNKNTLHVPLTLNERIDLHSVSLTSPRSYIAAFPNPAEIGCNYLTFNCNLLRVTVEVRSVIISWESEPKQRRRIRWKWLHAAPEQRVPLAVWVSAGEADAAFDRRDIEWWKSSSSSLPSSSCPYGTRLDNKNLWKRRTMNFRVARRSWYT